MVIGSWVKSSATLLASQRRCWLNHRQPRVWLRIQQSTPSWQLAVWQRELLCVSPTHRAFSRQRLFPLSPFWDASVRLPTQFRRFEDCRRTHSDRIMTSCNINWKWLKSVANICQCSNSQPSIWRTILASGVQHLPGTSLSDTRNESSWPWQCNSSMDDNRPFPVRNIYEAEHSGIYLMSTFLSVIYT